jgi:hypothetical protein
MAGKMRSAEQQWLESTDAAWMLEVLVRRFAPALSPRKLRLFACACCRRIEPWMTAGAVRAALEVAERFADDLAGEAELRQAREAALAVESPGLREAVRRSVVFAALPSAWDAAHRCPPLVRGARGEVAGGGSSALAAQAAEQREQAALLRDLFGNPFAPVGVDPAWLLWGDGTVRRLAETICDERRWREMPVLGDALEEAGCRAEAVLDHCRGSADHARGCWLLDQLLGRG